MSGSVGLAIAILLTAGLAAGFGLWMDRWFHRRQPRLVSSIFADGARGAVFLFDGDVLVDCSPAGRAILASGMGSSGPWVGLMTFLSPKFEGLEEKLRLLVEGGSTGGGPVTLASEGERPMLVTAEVRGGLIRITLVDAGDDQMPGQDPMTWRAQVEELDQLRAVVAQAPVLIWRERSDGAVIWANSAYVLELADRLEPGTDLAWPLPQLFDMQRDAGNKAGRRSLASADGSSAAWYDIQSRQVGKDMLRFAFPADQLEQAERSLREVLVTLTKTFAHLHVGLAIFDRQRQLQLFNPAMTDLTRLPVDFLARRPSLTAVLDAMRERKTIPEPKDYRTWRRQLSQMEKAAASGLYEETWSLPSGQTYRVIGRPHPDGALALILEDISDEMTRSRRYRAEIELGLSVIDGLDEAVAVFSQSGQLVMSNSAYAGLWGHDPAQTLGEATVTSLVDHWREAAAPSLIWASFEDLALGGGARQVITAEARLKDGRMITCRFTPLVGGATMAGFRVLPGQPGSVSLAGEDRLRA